jgi:coenzyme F420-reducing hydrogenase delta subunit
MSETDNNYVMIYLCTNCLPSAGRLSRQWVVDDLDVRTKAIPCSGKIDVQYMLRAFEGGAQGVCVVACQEGKCTLSEGNYRARVRVDTVKVFLTEIGMDPGQLELLHSSADDSTEKLQSSIDDAVRRIATCCQTTSGTEK